MKKAALFLCLLFGLSQPVLAQVPFATTSFEESTAVGGSYTDTGSAAADHDLVNNAGEPIVDYTSIGGELGFDAYYFNTRAGVGLTDGDYVGVTDYATVVGSYVDSSQGYQISDADGMMTVSIDQVDLTGAIAPFVSIYYFLQETGWEADDSLRIWVEVDGGVEIDLVNTAGSDIDDLAIEGTWNFVQVALTGNSSAILRFQLDSNSGSEAAFFDFVRFSDGPIPVELTSFVAAAMATGVELTWETASEQDNLGFNILRTMGMRERSTINVSLIPGAGTTLEPMFYSYVDHDVAVGSTYRYWLEQIDFQGTTELFGPVSVTTPTALPDALSLTLSPIPVDESATISLTIPSGGVVTVNLYDLQGREVAKVWNGEANAGVNTFNWERAGLGSGTYVLRADSELGSQSQRIVLK